MSWIVTTSNKRFHFDKFNPDDVCLEDIAHALSYTCRYNGMCHLYYSVAEHSMNIANWFVEQAQDKPKKQRDKLMLAASQALLHDAAEAYCGDMVKPLKDRMPQFKKYEHQLMSNIMEKYGLGRTLMKEVKEADTRIMFDEKAVLFPEDSPDWGWDAEPLGVKINCFTPPDIHEAYLTCLKARFGQYENAA